MLDDQRSWDDDHVEVSQNEGYASYAMLRRIIQFHGFSIETDGDLGIPPF